MEDQDNSCSKLHAWLGYLIFTVAVSMLLISFFYQPVLVEGSSMMPELVDQDRLLVNKSAYRIGKIHRGDVVVFLYPYNHRKNYIKRVIALPGDDLRIENGQVVVNGKALEENYLPAESEYHRSIPVPEMKIPDNEYFVMGDHRSMSVDSRSFGPIDRKLIYGKASFVYWPLKRTRIVR